MLHAGVTNFGYHRNLASMFAPTMLVAELSKIKVQRLLHWWTHLGRFRYKTVYIPGAENCWGNFLLKWWEIGRGARGEALGSVPLRAIAVSAFADAYWTLSSKTATQSS